MFFKILLAAVTGFYISEALAVAWPRCLAVWFLSFWPAWLLVSEVRDPLPRSTLRYVTMCTVLAIASVAAAIWTAKARGQ